MDIQSEQTPVSMRERIKAMLGTLRTNSDVRTDLALAAAGGVLAGVVTGEPGAAFVGIFAAQIVRPAVGQLREMRAREEAIRSDAASYRSPDQRFGVQYLVDAFRTGRTQLPQTSQGAVDGADSPPPVRE